MADIEKRISKDGKIVRYRARIRLKGKPVIYASFSTRSKALEWWNRTSAEAREGKYFKTIEAKKHTFTDFVDRYIADVLPKKPKSQKKQAAQLNWWKKELGHHTLAEVTPALIVEVRDRLLREPTPRGDHHSPSTVVRYLAVLSHAFTIAVREWGWIEDSPMRKVTKPKEPRGRVRFLDDEERMRLLNACHESKNPYLYLIVVLALSTGMRQGEILNLTWKDVDTDKGRIILHETKNGERRAVPITGHALDLLRQYATKRRLSSFLLFPGKNPKKPIDIRTAWLEALKKADIQDFRFHDLRHCAASYLAMGKATLTEIADVLGHKTLQMVKRYSHLSEGHTTKVISQMNERIFSGITDHSLSVKCGAD